MRPTALIAVNVFRESVRDKVLYNLVAFAVLLMGASYLIGQLTAGQDVKIIKDLGLAATSVFGLFIAIFIGIGLVSKEVEKRSIYSLLAKPINRRQIVLGKYAGLLLTLAVNLSVMALALYAVLASMGWAARPAVAAGLGASSGSIRCCSAPSSDICRALDRYRHGALLFNLFDTAPVCGADVWVFCRGAVQCRPAEFRSGRGVAGCGGNRARCIGFCRICAHSMFARRSYMDSRSGRLSRADERLRCVVHWRRWSLRATLIFSRRDFK